MDDPFKVLELGVRDAPLAAAFLDEHLPLYDPGVALPLLLALSTTHCFGILSSSTDTATSSSGNSLLGLIIIRITSQAPCGLSSLSDDDSLPPRHTAHIQAIAIHPGHRHKHLATQLYRDALRMISEMSSTGGGGLIRLSVQAEGKEGNGSREFWESVGLVARNGRRGGSRCGGFAGSGGWVAETQLVLSH